MKKNNIVITVLVALLTLGGGFFAGMKYQQSKRNAAFSNFNGSPGQRMFVNGNQNGNQNGDQGGRMMGNGFRPVDGEIISADDKGITVKLTDGSSKIIMISDTTSINNVQSATKSDLKVGAKVLVVGQTNTDGSVSAQNIQINPIVRAQGQGTQ
jgi:hypothetical protein